MEQTPSKEGNIPFKIPSIDKECSTYYKIFGDTSKAPALILMHGGPGAGHDYLLPFAKLWPLYGIPVVFYDMIGCGLSTHLPEMAGDKAFWVESLFLAELDNLIDQLGLRSGFHLLGQSFGGMLGGSYAADRPEGLRRLVLASGVASKDLALQGTRERIAAMDPEDQKVLAASAESKDFTSDAYKKSIGAYSKKNLCALDPWPEVLMKTIKNMGDDKTVYGSINGPAIVYHNGSWTGWTSIPGLHKIKAPTLVYNGEFDSSSDAGQVPYFELIPRVRWVSFTGLSHMCHLDDEPRIMRLVGEFLTQPDPA